MPWIGVYFSSIHIDLLLFVFHTQLNLPVFNAVIEIHRNPPLYAKKNPNGN